MDPQLSQNSAPAKPWYVAPQPAFGIAWSPRGGDGVLGSILGHDRTVVRAGYSLRRFTEPQQYFWNQASDYGAVYFQSFFANANSTGATGTFAPGSLTWQGQGNGVNLPNGYGFAPTQYQKSYPFSSFTLQGGPGINGVEANIRQPYTESWNFGIQRQLSETKALEIRYVGNRSLRQWIVLNPNEVNIFESGFLNQFKAAQANLAANNASGNPNYSGSFANHNLPGQQALSFFDAAFAGESAGADGSFADYTNPGFTFDLGTGQAGGLASVFTGIGGPVAADPNFSLAHLALSDAWSSYGDNKRAQEEAKKALDLSAGLSREQSLMIEARYYESLHQWDKAIDLRRTLFNFFPDSLNHGLELVGTQSAAGKGTDSLATIELLRKLPFPDRNDPRIDLAESLAANVVSDYKREAAAAVQAVQKAQAIGARVLVARARISEARAYMEMGQKDKVAPVLYEAQEIFRAVGDRFHAARVLQQVGLAYYYQGKLDEARKTYEQALAIQRELGNRSNQAKVLNGIALVLQDQNDLDGAQQYYLQALALCREVDDRAMTGTVLGNLAGIEFYQGNFEGAKTHLQESLDIARRVGEQSGIALQLENLGEVLVAEGSPRDAVPLYKEAVQISRKTGKHKDLTTILIDRGDLQVHLGELSAARSSYQEALQISTTAGDQQAIGIATRSLGLIHFEQGELAAARKSYEQALAILEKVADTRFVHDVRMALAELNLEDGLVSDAEHESRLAVDEFRKAKDPDSLASAQTLLARALLAQHKSEDALNIAVDAIKVASKGGHRNTQISAACAESDVRTASGKAADAANTLKQLVNDSHQAGLVPDEFDARLALGQAEIKAGHSSNGRALLASLERDAHAKGFLLVARKASAARRRSTHD